MIKKIVLTALLCTSVASTFAADANYNNVVPFPQSIELQKGKAFVLNEGTPIVYVGTDTKMKQNADFLAEYINQLTHLKLNVTTSKQKNVAAIVLAIDPKINGEEAYSLTVSNKGIKIAGKTAAGVFYGIQTLRKSLPVLDNAEAITLPATVISDAPRFGYRGMMLDCGRHFWPVPFVKKFIDILALHNMNVFHWHLNEDQGWRIEIKKYPKLTEIGSKRSCTVLGHNSDIDDGTPYEGFYTQDEAREIVRYAAERNITVIPEIDMPGHTVAALASYPELGCTGGPYNVWCRWGIAQDVLCAGNPKTLDFLHKVMDEVCEVFPGKLIHIGGDESPRNRWKACPKCQKKMKELGLKKEAELQTYINKDIEAYLAAKGREIIGWDETLEGGLSEKASVMSWRGYKGGIEAARQHHHVVMSPTNHCYIDYYQLKNHDAQPLAIGGYLPVSTVYSMEPVPAELTEEEGKFIVGAQCNLWTEYVVSPDHAMYMLLPRLAAMCEVQWMQPQAKNYEEFSKKRLPAMLSIYRSLGYKYCSTIE